MQAILGGFGAAVAWALSGLFSSRSSRAAEPRVVVAWMMILGLAVTAPFVISDGIPARLDWSTGGWLALAGGGNILGLLMTYAAYREGAAVVLIAPLVATNGAIAALIAIGFGESVGPVTAVSLVVIVVGIALAAVPPRDQHEILTPAHEHVALAPTGEPVPVPLPAPPPPGGSPPAVHSGRVLALAAVASLSFGCAAYAVGRVSSRLPLSWVILPPRLVGVVLLVPPLLASGRLRTELVAPVWPMVAGAGICEVIGYGSYGLGARDDVAVAAVVSSQYAAIAAIAAFLLWRERLGRIQLVGVVMLAVGVAILSGFGG